MESEFVKYISTLGVGGIIAGFMFLIYRQDHLRVVEILQRSMQREDSLLQVMQRTAIANEALTQTMTAMMSQTQSVAMQQSNDMRVLLERLLDERSGHG